jgi:hypothetical protein
MTTRPALFESLETRRLMSATCADALAAEAPSQPAMLLPAVQKVWASTARLPGAQSSITDGTSNTLLIAEKLRNGSSGAIVDGTSNTILFAESYR